MQDLESFKSWLARGGRKKNTIKDIIRSVKILLNEASPFTCESINNLLWKRYESGLKGKYLNHFVIGARLWGQYNNIEDLNRCQFFKEENYVKATLSDEEIEAFLILPPPTRSFTHYKSGKSYTSLCDVKGHNLWTLFFSILAYTGMRPGEVAHLTIDRVDFGRQIFILEDTKTNTPRFVPIPPNIAQKIKDYISTIPGPYLFPSSRGGKSDDVVFDDVDWNYRFHVRLKRLGIKRKNLTPYSLRHSFITRLLEEDVNLFKVQKIVGHRQIATTAHYTHLTTKDLMETVKKHPLVRRSTNPTEILRNLLETIYSYELDRDERFCLDVHEFPGGINVAVTVKAP